MPPVKDHWLGHHGERAMSMKSILVPMEPHEGMSAVLETALLLAKKCGSYIEGFPLRFGISEFVAVDPAGRGRRPRPTVPPAAGLMMRLRAKASSAPTAGCSTSPC